MDHILHYTAAHVITDAIVDSPNVEIRANQILLLLYTVLTLIKKYSTRVKYIWFTRLADYHYIVYTSIKLV